MTKDKKLNMVDLAMDWAIVEPRKRFKTATDCAYYLEKDFRRCYEQGKKDKEQEWNKRCEECCVKAKLKSSNIKKELLEKVLKEVMNEMVMRPQKPKQIPRTVLQPIRAWLEQELKRLQK